MALPTIDGTELGIPRTIYGSDGTDWYALKVRDSGILEVCSKSGDKIFGFESIVEEAKANENLAAGTNTLDGTAVGTGKVWKITQASIVYVGTVPTKLYISVPGLAGGVFILYQASPVSTTRYVWSGEIYLQVGDYVRGSVEGATLHDDLYFRYAGVQMNAP